MWVTSSPTSTRRWPRHRDCARLGQGRAGRPEADDGDAVRRTATHPRVVPVVSPQSGRPVHAHGPPRSVWAPSAWWGAGMRPLGCPFRGSEGGRMPLWGRFWGLSRPQGHVRRPDARNSITHLGPKRSSAARRQLRVRTGSKDVVPRGRCGRPLVPRRTRDGLALPLGPPPALGVSVDPKG